MQPAPQQEQPTTLGDCLRAVLVVVFAFFVASFPAQNADVWLHLATGRALVQGESRPGVDPFSYMTADATWTNHAWLFDAAGYGLHQAFGGSGLVVAKAALIALLAFVMVRLCWRGPHRWLALLLIAVSLAALGPFAVLRPICVSLLFLGITYAWLERRPSASGWRSAVPILILFAAWANLDEWFVLGPALVVLWWLGTLLRRQNDRVGSESRAAMQLVVVAVAGAAIAMLNPHHVRVFTLPTLVDPQISEDRFEDAFDRAAMQSPLKYLDDADSIRQPARVAYGVLIGAGVLSFLVQGAKLSSARLLVWLALLALSVYRAGAIPFFAVVAGPIAALNLRDWLIRRSATESGPTTSRLIAGLLRFVSLLIFAAIAASGWTGWVHGWPGETRRWELALDPSLEAAAKQLAQWHADGKVGPNARALPTSSAAAYALAWHCPAQKSFCDERTRLFPAEIQYDFAKMRNMLFGAGGDPQEAKGWRALLDRHGITHLIVDHRDDLPLTNGLRRLFPSPLWTLHYLQGRTTIFARADGEALKSPVVDASARVFAPGLADQAPASGPTHDPQPRSWLDAFYRPGPIREPDRDECRVWQAHFGSQRSRYSQRLVRVWEPSLAAGVVGLPLAELSARMPAGLLLRGACLRYARGVERTDRSSALYAIALQVFQRFAALQDDGPPGSLLLAIRAARRALASSPDDALTWLNLGEAYLSLRRQTRERVVGNDFGLLEQVRRIQTLTALRTAVALNPELASAHDLLASLYAEIGHFDLALEHVQELVKLETRPGPRPDETPAEFRERLGQLEDLEKRLARQVRDAQLAVRSQELDAFAKAQIAVKNGLPRQALDILLKADAASLGHGGILLELNLLLQTGRLREVSEFLTPELEAPLGRNTYCWLQTYLAAARGDYAKVERELDRLDVGIDLPDLRLRRAAPHRALALVVSRFLLDQAGGILLPIAETAESLPGRADYYRSLMRQEADVAALRGMLALEAGDIGKAQQHFRRSLQFDDETQGSVWLARRYLKLIER